jgi:hypothetical protein
LERRSIENDLRNWQASPFLFEEMLRTNNPDGTETLVVRDKANSQRQRFMRLKVSRNQCLIAEMKDRGHRSRDLNGPKSLISSAMKPAVD